MPAYNAARYVGAALRSATHQSYRRIEIIVVDDGSTDDTAEVVQRIAERDQRVRLVAQPNGGVAAARNAGIAAARGEYVAPFDADDVWAIDKIERQVRRFSEAGHDAGVVYGWWRRVTEDGRLLYASEQVRMEGRVEDALVLRNFLGTASIPLIRRACLERVGGYDADARAQAGPGCEDWDLALRIAEHYRFALEPAFLLEYRDTPGSMSYDFTGMLSGYERMLDRLQQRRPDISRRLLRESRSTFMLCLAKKGFALGQRRTGWRHTRKAAAADPTGFLARAAGGMIGEAGRRLRRPPAPPAAPEQATQTPPAGLDGAANPAGPS